MVAVLCCEHEESLASWYQPHDYDQIRTADREKRIAQSAKDVRAVIDKFPKEAALLTDAAQREQDSIRHEDDVARAEQQDVLPPNGYRIIPLSVAVDHPELFHYTLGKIVYRDIFDPTKDHTTKFCLVQHGNQPLRLCDTGQDMD
jgi:hypothetical protein